MASYEISAALAQQRHPQIYQALVERLLKPTKTKTKTTIPTDPGLWTWTYRMAERIDGSDLPASLSALKGRALLQARADAYFFSLEASVGRRRVEETLQVKDLLAGPDEALPLELLRVRPRPAGEGVWLWRPDDESAPGWQEHTLVAAAQGKQGWFLTVADANGFERCYVFDPVRDEGREVVSMRGLLKASEARELAHVLEKGEASVRFEPLALQNVTDHLKQASQGWADLKVRRATVEELLGVLSQDPGFMVMGGPIQETVVPTPPAHARRFPWNTTLLPEEMASLDALRVAGEPGFTLGAMLGNLMNPGRAVGEQVRRLACLDIAGGATIPQALANSVSSTCRERGWSAPGENADPVQHLHQQTSALQRRRGPKMH